MIDTPYVTQSEACLMAFIAIRVPRGEIREVMGPALRELMSAVMDQGIGAGKPWFAHHLRIRPEIFEFEICVAVTSRDSSRYRSHGSPVQSPDQPVKTEP